MKTAHGIGIILQIVVKLRFVLRPGTIPLRYITKSLIIKIIRDLNFAE